MRKLLRKLKDRAGLSVLEMLVALFLSGIVTAAVFELYISQHKNWNIQDDVINIQQNARAAIDELTRQIRMAGHALPIGIDGIESFNTDPDTILVNYSPDGCNVPTASAMAHASAQIDCTGGDISCFYAGQLAYIFHPDSGGSEFFIINSLDVGGAWIQPKDPLSKAYPAEAIVMTLQRIKYFIDNTTDTLHPNLMIQLPAENPAIYAENIDDLQFRYTMKNGSVFDIPPIPEDVREVEISLSAHSEKPDMDFEENPYRRRSYTTKVNLRNLQ